MFHQSYLLTIHFCLRVYNLSPLLTYESFLLTDTFLLWHLPFRPAYL